MRQDEMPVGADCFRYFAGAARTMHALGTGEYIAGYTSMVRRDPIGVIGSITPWNYPLLMAIWKLAPALAGGNTVMIKPSEITPLSTLKLAKTIAEIFSEGWSMSSPAAARRSDRPLSATRRSRWCR